MKIVKLSVCLLASSLLALPARAQEAASPKEAGAQAADKAAATDKGKAQDQGSDKQTEKDKDKEAVPEKVVSEKEAIKQVMGDYRIVSGEKDGEQVLPERLVDVTVRFTEKTVTTYDGEKNQRFSATYRLDTQQRPWRIRMTSAPQAASGTVPQSGAGASPVASTSDGLIEIVEGRVKVIYALPGGTAPKTFRAGDRQQMFELEKLPDPTEKPESKKQ